MAINSNIAIKNGSSQILAAFLAEHPGWNCDIYQHAAGGIQIRMTARCGMDNGMMRTVEITGELTRMGQLSELLRDMEAQINEAAARDRSDMLGDWLGFPVKITDEVPRDAFRFSPEFRTREGAGTQAVNVEFGKKTLPAQPIRPLAKTRLEQWLDDNADGRRDMITRKEFDRMPNELQMAFCRRRGVKVVDELPPKVQIRKKGIIDLDTIARSAMKQIADEFERKAFNPKPPVDTGKMRASYRDNPYLLENDDTLIVNYSNGTSKILNPEAAAKPQSEPDDRPKKRRLIRLTKKG